MSCFFFSKCWYWQYTFLTLLLSNPFPQYFFPLKYLSVFFLLLLLAERIGNYGIILTNLSTPGGKCLFPTPGEDLFYICCIFSMATSQSRGTITDRGDRRAWVGLQALPVT